MAKTMPLLQQEGPKLVDYGRSTGDKPVAHTMHRLEIKLGVRLDRNKPHVLPVYRLGDGFGIEEVVLVRLHEWLHELGWNQLHVMTLFRAVHVRGKCAHEHASIPIKEVCMLAVKVTICF